ncbi:hypothetical protein ACIGD1_09610 [Streptomyces sp. NPDC085612]|uniref:hypothetical protein n=1 Tax=Streptomyces sp. NPDC085612 TaxID=3365732 RepID=UPI0037D3B17E
MRRTTVVWGEELLGRFAALVAARAEHTATRAFFTRRAGAWEERFAHQTPAYEAAVARMRLAPGRRALDLGCGTGRAMPALRRQVGPRGQVLGIVAEHNLRPALETTGWLLDEYEDAAGHFPARAVPLPRP